MLDLFGALFGGGQKKPAPAPDPIPQAPIDYDRMRAILNSGVLKNPNASMTPVARPTPAPAPAPVDTRQRNPLEALFGSLFAAGGQNMQENPIFRHFFGGGSGPSN